MSYLSRKPISSLVLKFFSDRHTPFESPFKGEQKYVSLFLKYFLLPGNIHLFQIKVGILPVNLSFLHQKSVIMQHKYHIRNHSQKPSRTTYILIIFKYFNFFLNFHLKMTPIFGKKLKFVLKF